MATEQAKRALLGAAAKVAAEAAVTVTGVEAARLVRGLYAEVSPDELSGLDAGQLFGAARQLWSLALGRQVGDIAVRVYNPCIDTDGWHLDSTVVDIVSSDMPFIVDSVLALLDSMGLVVDLLAHPVAAVERDGPAITSVTDPQQAPAAAEIDSFVHLHIDRVSGEVGLAELAAAVESVVGDVRSAVEGWPAMVETARRIARELDGWAAEADAGHARFERSIGHGADEIAELLRFMADGSFTFIGYREYDLIDGERLVARPGSGLGVMAGEPTNPVRELHDPPELAAMARRPIVANLTKANTTSTVHRASPLDYVGVKEIDPAGRVTGERRFIGLYTADVYNKAVSTVPVIRERSRRSSGDRAWRVHRTIAAG